jgi:5-formyltetrahydrofolate cyclo-ligase
MTVPAEKRALRERMLGVRASIPPGVRSEAARAIAAALAALPAWGTARTVALYLAMGSEVDTSAVAALARAGGKRIAWPRLRNGERAMEFAACDPAALVEGARGTREPPPALPAIPPAEIDLVLVPGLAFDGAGRRLGRGGGHYDATLAALPGATAVGLAYDAQVVPAVPSEPHDARLAAVVTERRTLVPAGAAGRARSR